MQGILLSAPQMGSLRPIDGQRANLPTSIPVKVGAATKDFPVSYFEGDPISCGQYLDVKTNRRFAVDQNRIDHWIEQFGKMRQAGIEITAPTDHSLSARDNLGFVIGARRDGDKLMLTYQFIGEDAVPVVLRNRASLYIHPKWTDGRGQAWDDVILHSALTPIPVIPGQSGFAPIAASRGGEDFAVFQLSTAKGVDMPLPTELKQKAIQLGAKPEMSDDEMVKHVFDGACTCATQLSQANEKLQRQGGFQLSARELKLTGDLAVAKVDGLITAGKITAAQADVIKSKIMPKAGEYDPIMLSGPTETDASPFELALNVLELNASGVKPGATTGPQPTVLARKLAGGGAQTAAATDEDKLAEDTREFAKSLNKNK